MVTVLSSKPRLVAISLKGLESAAATTLLVTDVANDAHAFALLGARNHLPQASR